MDIITAKLFASIGVSVAVGVVGWKTQNPNTLWGLLIVAMIW